MHLRTLYKYYIPMHVPVPVLHVATTMFCGMKALTTINYAKYKPQQLPSWWRQQRIRRINRVASASGRQRLKWSACQLLLVD